MNNLYFIINELFRTSLCCGDCEIVRKKEEEKGLFGCGGGLGDGGGRPQWRRPAAASVAAVFASSERARHQAIKQGQIGLRRLTRTPQPRHRDQVILQSIRYMQTLLFTFK